MLSTAETITEKARLARRSVARGVIVEAGRRLAARDGISNLSLSAVAVEAGFNPSTVFGHFRNKDELALAIVAEDLASMAALMREGSAANTFVEPLPCHVDTNVVSAESAVGSGIEQEQAAFLISHEPSITESKNVSESAARVDAWLERRLRIFEHMLGDLEHRLKETETGTARALALSEDGMKSLFDRMEAFERQQGEAAQSLAGRMEETERRQRGATAEMRAAVNDAATRIEILEAARRTETDRASRQPVSDARQPPTQVPENLAAATAPDQEAYQATAQRAADAAAALVELEETPVAPAGWRRFAEARVQVTKKHYTMAVCAAVIAFVLGAFVAFYAGQARGRELAAAAAATVPHPIFHHLRAEAAAIKRQPQKHVSLTSDPRARLATLARIGNPQAELLMGLDLLRGNGTAPDQPKAAGWIRRAAEQHDPVAQYYLGTLYEHGDGVTADSAEALRWYEAAAEQGNRKAMHALGVAYAQGAGTQKDYSAAARWFTKAAELGLVNSEFNLGVLYERGLGVHQSLLDAFKWYSVAAVQGDLESNKRIDALKTQLSADDLNAAQAAASSFRPADPNREANTIPPLTALVDRSLPR